MKNKSLYLFGTFILNTKTDNSYSKYYFFYSNYLKISHIKVMSYTCIELRELRPVEAVVPAMQASNTKLIGFYFS